MVDYPANTNKTDAKSSKLENINSKKDDFFSLCQEAREKLDEELSPIFKNKTSREKFIKTVIDDDVNLGILEDSGKIKYTSTQSKKALYTAIDNYWVRFGAASRKEEEIEQDEDDYDDF